MQLHTFIADSAADAVSQVRSKLGPEAVVLSVRRLPADGLARIWRRPRIEVLAHVPAPAPLPAAAPVAPAAPVASPLIPASPAATSAHASSAVRDELFSRLRDELAEIRRSVACREPFSDGPQGEAAPQPPAAGGWRAGAVLERTGLLPRHAHRVMDQVRSRVGEQPPATLQEELEAVAEALEVLILPRFHPAPPARESGIHIFVGPPGVGKTTCVCKWLTQAVLVEGRPAEVWRLDGSTSNTAEVLSVYGEILNVPVFRTIPDDALPPEPGRLVLIDLPGGSSEDPSWLASLDALLQRVPSARLHLVLNASYDAAILQKQVRAFSGLALADVSFTHLDEENRAGKIWNLLLGTNCRPGFLAGGQNIPGDFSRADARGLVQRLLPSIGLRKRGNPNEMASGKPAAMQTSKVIE